MRTVVTAHLQEAYLTARVEAHRGGQKPTRQTVTLTSKTISQSLTGSIRFTVSKFRHCLTLFSKSFSPFPHGTCFLSVSNQYLASDESYHPLCAPIPRNVTLSRYTVHRGLHMASRTLTLIDALFQETYICASVGNTSPAYKSRPQAPISMLSSSLLIRHYYGDPV